MIERVTIDGRSGLACFIDSKFKPVPEAQASFYKIVFDDGGQLILGAGQSAPPSKKAAGDTFTQDPTTGRLTGSTAQAGALDSGGNVKPELQGEIAASLPPRPKEKGKFKVDDFGKAGISLDPAMRNEKDETSKKFVERWNDSVRDAPEDFKNKFLGGLKGSMRMSYDEDAETIKMQGYLEDENGNSLAEYTREIDFDDKKAESVYFKVNEGAQGHGIGKTMLAGNIATYQQLGLHRVEVHADIDIGGHAWARYGYVPTAQSWRNLRSYISGEIDDLQHGGSGHGGTPDEWDAMSSSQQDRIRDAWIDQNIDEIRQSDVDNWRDQGGDLHEAKLTIATKWIGGRNLVKSQSTDWARDVLKDETTVTVKNEAQGELFSNKPVETQVDLPELIDVEKLIKATDMDFNDRNGDGRADPEITIDAKATPELNDEQRDEIVSVLTEAFNEKAEEDRSDIDPPSWVDDSSRDSAGEYFDNMGDSEAYDWAKRNGELPEVDDSGGGESEISDQDADSLRDLLHSENPKALWQIADSKWGKKLLIDADWFGVIDLADKETMDRFNAYVGKKPSQKAAAS